MSALIFALSLVPWGPPENPYPRRTSPLNKRLRVTYLSKFPILVSQCYSNHAQTHHVFFPYWTFVGTNTKGGGCLPCLEAPLSLDQIIDQNKDLSKLMASSHSTYLHDIISFVADSFFFSPLRKEDGLKLHYRTGYFPIVHTVENLQS